MLVQGCYLAGTRLLQGWHNLLNPWYKIQLFLIFLLKNLLVLKCTSPLQDYREKNFLNSLIWQVWHMLFPFCVKKDISLFPLEVYQIAHKIKDSQ